MNSIKRSIVMFLILAMTMTSVYAVASVIVTGYEVDDDNIRKGDSFELKIRFKKVGDGQLGNNLSLINTSGSVFAGADGKTATAITNPTEAFKDSVKLNLKYSGEGNTFSFKLIDDSTGETIASDSITIKEVSASSADDDKPATPVDSSKIEPKLEIGNQPFKDELVSTKLYDQIVRVDNTSNHIAKDIVVTLQKGEDELPFDLAASKLTSGLPQILYKKSGKAVLHLVVNSTAQTKRYRLNLKLDYKNSHGDSFSRLIPVFVKVNNVNKLPIVDIIGTNIESGIIDTRAAKDVTLSFSNGGTLNANGIKVELTGFAANGLKLVDDFDTKYIGDMGPGQRADLAFKIIAMPGASGVQALTAKISYTDADGNTYNKESQVFIQLKEQSLIDNQVKVKFNRGQYYMMAGGSVKTVVTVSNQSAEDLKNVNLTVNANGLKMMSTYVKLLDTLKAGGSKSFTFIVSSDEATDENTYPINADVTFSGKSENAKILAVSGITVNKKSDTATGKPKVIIAGYDYAADHVLAGQAFPLTVQFKNTSASMGIKNVKASYTSEGNTFIPVDSSNAIFLEKIAPGEIVSKTIMVKTKNDSEAKTYKMDFTIAYEDAKGNAYDAKNNPYEEKESISINLKQKNRLEVSQFTAPQSAAVGDTARFDVNFFNMGKSTMYNMLVTTEGDFDTVDTTNYVGTFEPGKSEYYTVSIVPKKTGELKGKIIFSYEDSNGEKETLERPFTVKAVEGGGEQGGEMGGFDMGSGDGLEKMDEYAEPPAGELPIVPLAAGGLAVLAGGGYLIYRRNKKRREQLMEIDDEAE